MFITELSPTYHAPASIQYLDEDGKLVEGKFDVKFARLDAEETRELSQRVNAGTCDDAEFFGKVLRGWRGVAGPDGTALPFTPAAFDLACKKLQGFGKACAVAWFASIAPKQAAHQAAEKN